MQKVNFKWIRGDDQSETLVFTNTDGSLLDLTDYRIDLHIKPKDSDSKPIKLSTTNGTIKVNINKVTFVVGNALTDGVDWERANWDLQTISRDGVVKTLVGGEIKLIHDITRGD
ncbi:hypothetical protein NMW79_04990 [Pasteurella multocida]|uniref:hypothetical protein n=1 Tax=Pasteurella canis TaxID=753 RepID=UPI001CBD0950|nr:hypothetical protein [Pasteurella canis]MDY0685632.1 hypothetical protein [Pasteurella multocida]UAX42497.1 hypothetical protein K7G89_000315 [Pasteurella canis]HDX1106382.1 hypothetical protein [Pasteurella multocida]